MDNDRREKIAQALQRLSVNQPCPRCQNFRFSVVGEGFISLNADPGTINLGGPGIPTAIVACDRCGFITEHALKVLGLA